MIVRRDLPTFSEGMVILGSRALVVVDGDEPPAAGDPCAVPSRQYFVPLD